MVFEGQVFIVALEIQKASEKLLYASKSFSVHSDVFSQLTPHASKQFVFCSFVDQHDTSVKKLNPMTVNVFLSALFKCHFQKQDFDITLKALFYNHEVSKVL